MVTRVARYLCRYYNCCTLLERSGKQCVAQGCFFRCTHAVRLTHRSDEPKRAPTLREDESITQGPLSTRAIPHGATSGLVDESLSYLSCESLPPSCGKPRTNVHSQTQPNPNPTTAQPSRADPLCTAFGQIPVVAVVLSSPHLLIDPFHGQSNRTGTTSTSTATGCSDSSLRGLTTTLGVPRFSTAMGEGRTTTCCSSTGSPCSTTRGTRQIWFAPSRRTSHCTTERRPACAPAGSTRSGTTLSPPLFPAVPTSRHTIHV